MYSMLTPVTTKLCVSHAFVIVFRGKNVVFTVYVSLSIHVALPSSCFLSHAGIIITIFTRKNNAIARPTVVF